MRTTHLAAALVSLLALVACVPSLHPVFTKKEVVYEPKLLGTWIEEVGDKESWTFEKGRGKGYKLINRNRDEVRLHSANLVKLGDLMFLDLYPWEKRLPRDKYEGVPFLAVHYVIRIESIEPDLKWAAMNPGRLESLLEKDPKALKHEMVDGHVVITASTPELQAFVKKHAKDGIFGKPSVLRRKAE